MTAAVPPTAAIGMSLFTYAQLQRSWYMFFFLSPLAEIALPMDDFDFIDGLWADWSPGYDGSWDLARVKESIGDPAHIAAAIGYYRALYDARATVPGPGRRAGRRRCSPPQARRCTCTAGTTAACCSAPSADPLDFLAEGSQMEVVDEAGHFLKVEQPEVVNRHILDFIAP